MQHPDDPGRLELAREAVREHLSVRSYEHSVRVADTAVHLASAYEVDHSEAWLAGLLHDWSRDDDPKGLVAKARRFGIEMTSCDSEVPYLLHGKVAAAEIPDVLPWVPRPVLDAVASHTLGCVDSCDLVKVLYVADSIEPHRVGESVRALREAVGDVDLDELYVRTYIHTLRTIVERRRRLHPMTISVWNAIVDRTVR